MNEEIETEKDFLQIKAIRTSSNAFVMKLEEGDIIVAEGLKKVRPRGKIKPITK